jgi:hypothetical protein
MQVRRSVGLPAKNLKEAFDRQCSWARHVPSPLAEAYSARRLAYMFMLASDLKVGEAVLGKGNLN